MTVTRAILKHPLQGTKVVPKRKKEQRRLSFDTIEIIELPIILGDNPSVQDGPPLAVSWMPQFRVTVELETFEAIRPPRKKPCRLCKTLRKKLLQKHGFPQKEIEQAILEARQTQLDRQRETEVAMIAVKKARLEKFFQFSNLTSPLPPPGPATATSLL